MNVFSSLDIVKQDQFKQKLLYKKRLSSNNRFTNKILSAIPSQIKSRPLMLHIETVNICNHNCIFCAKESNQNNKMIMPMDLFVKVVSDYADIGGGRISLTPSPGEIFLDPFLLKRLQILKRYPQITNISITSNGIGSENYKNHELQDIISRFDRIHISIYGLNEEEYSKITRRQTFENCISSIRRIVEYARPNTVIFGFRLLYTRSEAEIKRWIQSNFGRDIPFGFTTEYTTWGSLIGSKLNELPGEARWKKMPEISNPCFRPLISIKVCASGDLSLCACSDKSATDLLLGSVMEQSIESMYNSQKCKKFWSSGENVPESCKKCSSYQSIDEFNPIWLERPIDYIGG
jgi:MoaA/NifB/PqqE/SkfB family radical SAM enzyme